MTERNITRYHLEQSDNKSYILTTSLLNDKLKLTCQDSQNQIFFGAFTLMDLLNLSHYFQTTRSVDQVQQYLNGIVEKQRVEIYQDSTCIKIILHLINKDKIIIPLTKQIKNQKNNYYNIQNMSNISNQYIPTQIPTNSMDINYSNSINYSDPQIISNIPQTYMYPQNSNQYLTSQTYNVEQNLNGISNIEIPGINNTINSNINQLASSPIISSYPQADSSFNYQMNKLENDLNIIRPEQEKITNELKRVLDQAEKFKQENDLYKQENALLNNENTSLKTENENLRKELKQFKEQYDKLKNEYSSFKKEIPSIQEQNKELLKIKETYESQIPILQNNLEQINKDNEVLKQNITVLSNQNESLIKENNSLKNSQTKSQPNEEEINNLMEELNSYRIKAQENELLKKQLEDLQYQIQMMQERQEDEDVKEVKGDIIHDMNELEMITKKINKENKRIIINLLYKASADSDSAAVFHEKCDSANNTIVLVETKDGKRFGGYTTQSWRGNCIDKPDPDAFIFSFDKMKTYDNIPGDDAIGCYPKFGPIFLGCQIKIFDNAFTKGGTTFEKELNFNTEEDYELTGGSRTFDVKDIEVYEVIIEDINN
jgi:prefoldin subunit 5